MDYKYLCEICKYNNNGWCNFYRINGLKKKNVQKCNDFESKNQDTFQDLYNAVDKFLYDVSTQYKVGYDIEPLLIDVRNVMDNIRTD